jgi:hypothetical protein
MTRRRFVSVLAAFTLTFSMLAAIPARAFALVPTSATITIIADADNPIEATVGKQLSLDSTNYYTVTNILPTGADEWHIDYKVTQGDAYVTVNKHSGILTPTSPTNGEVVIVTVYFTPITMPSGNPNNPCADPLASGDLYITVSPAPSTGAYMPGETYQGLNQALTLRSPDALTYTINYTPTGGVEGYVNEMGTIGAADTDAIDFDITMSYGTGPDFAAWEQYNNGNVILRTPGSDEYVIGSSPYLSFSGSAPSNLVTVVVGVPALLDAGEYSLTFTAGFCSGNSEIPSERRTLQAPITFYFTLE